MLGQRQFLLRIFKLFDIFVMVNCFAFASWISYLHWNGLKSFEQFLALRIKIINFILFTALILLWHFVLNAFDLYRSKRLSNRWREIFSIFKATLLGTLFVYVAGRIFNIEIISLQFLAIFWITNLALMILSRLILRWGLGWIRRRGRNLRYMIIVGTGKRAIDFARKIDSRPELGYRIAGFIDSNWEGMADFEKTGYRVVSDVEGFAAYIRQNVVDEVVISLPLRSKYRTASQIAKLCEQQGIVIRCLSDIFDLKASKIRTASLDGLPLVSNYTGALEGWQVELKRLFDILVSGIGAVISLPIFFFVAIAVKITSPGPIFFIQERVGLNKRHFRMYKFRTMVPGAEIKQDELEAMNEADGPVFKIKKDPRITPIGRILRRLSFDELPQLINVLIGDMSLVGPRPLPVRDYNAFSEDWHRRRFSVRPGITCLWQIAGRSNIPFSEWMELDMDYIDQWSLWLDIKILAKSFSSTIRGSGAY